MANFQVKKIPNYFLDWNADVSTINALIQYLDGVASISKCSQGLGRLFSVQVVESKLLSFIIIHRTVQILQVYNTYKASGSTSYVMKLTPIA